MNGIPQQLLISGTVLFLLGLLIGFAVPLLPNSRTGMGAHVTGIQSGMILWALGLMWERLALPDSAQRAVQILSVLGLFATIIGLLLAAVWRTSRATPIAGAGHQATLPREAVVTALLGGGSLAILVATALVLWGLCAWKA